jgi:hypothetical protein
VLVADTGTVVPVFLLGGSITLTYAVLEDLLSEMEFSKRISNVQRE